MTAAAPIVERPILTFEEETHEYRVDGRVVESVTQVLGKVWPEIWPWRSEFAMERGRRVHAALNYWLLGDLDAKSLSPTIAGYVACGIRWLTESGFELATFNGAPATEVRLYSQIYDYAGTADLFGSFERKRAVVDFKTGEPGWAAGPQTWAYAHAWQEETGEVVARRYALRLYDDGTPALLVPYRDNRNDQADFLAALRVLQRRKALTA